jgi:choline-sulfatase
MTEKPNILILFSDQHNRKLSGCYGNGLIRTPNIDRLASGGMTFTDAYCPAPLCVPSRMSFMTGCQPSTLKIRTNYGILPSEVPCWTHYLGLAGYEPRLIGRMHFVGPDQHHGFFREIGELAQPVNSWTIRNEGNRQNRNSVKVGGKGLSPYLWYDRQIAEYTCEFLRNRAENASRPFAAVAGFLAPHNPYIAPPELFDYYYERIDIPDDEMTAPQSIDIYKQNHGFKPAFKKEQIHRTRAAYFGLCEAFDQVVGTILECLDETGLNKNTIVVYMSDHGDMAGEKGCWTKSCYYEGSAGVPLIIRAPGITKPGARCSNIVNLYDLAPTFCNLAGAESMRHIDGHSLLNLMKGDSSGWKDETFSELFNIAGNIVSRMVRSKEWKLWQDETSGVPPALFNLNDDDELNDLGKNPQYAAIRERLLTRLHKDWSAKTAAAEARKEKIGPPDYRDKSAEILNDWREIVSAWNSRYPDAGDKPLFRPEFPPELDSQYQPPV